MNKEQINKMQQGRKESKNLQVSFKIGEIKIKSYENGWLLFYNKQGQRYYGSLQDLFKNLFDLKLRESSAKTLEELQREQDRCLKEVKELVFALEREIIS